MMLIKKNLKYIYKIKFNLITVQIKKDKVIFTRDIREELRKNSIYSELIEDIEDRMKLEQAVKEQKQNGDKFTDFDVYDKKRMNTICVDWIPARSMRE